MKHWNLIRHFFLIVECESTGYSDMSVPPCGYQKDDFAAGPGNVRHSCNKEICEFGNITLIIWLQKPSK